jgi:phage/plasmid-associated DNA primase
MLIVLDCTIDLHPTGDVSVHEHNSDDLITSLAPIHFYEGATADLFVAMLERYYPEPDRRQQLQDNAGYVLTGLSKRHSLNLVGPHDAGKSMTLKLVANVLGDYAGSLDPEAIMKNPHGSGGGAAKPDLWRVHNKRLITVAEVPPGARIDPILFKLIHGGGDKLTMRDLYQSSQEVQFVGSVWMSGNEPYGPPPKDTAAFDRMGVLECDHVHPESSRVAADELATTDPSVTGDAVLMWAIEGFKRVYGQQGGVPYEPESSLKAKSRLVDALDPWSLVLNELFEFTGTPDADTDGVLKAAAWDWAKKYRQDVDERWRVNPRDALAFEDTMARMGAILPYRSHIVFENKLAWRGVEWRADVGTPERNDPERRIAVR